MLSSKLWALAVSCVMALAVSNVAAQQPSLLSQASEAASDRTQTVPGSVTGAASLLVAAPKSGWSAAIGGAAAGLGLAWLASSFGLDDGAAQFMLLLLIAVAVLVAVGLLRRRRVPSTSGLVHQAGSSGGSGSGNSQLDPFTPKGYSSKNVGNDASARPWEQHSAAAESVAGHTADPTPVTPPEWGVPHGFDTDSFLKTSKSNFVSLQAAWDRSDIAALRAMMTDSMLEQIKVQLTEREQIQGVLANQTDVVMLEARLLGIEEVGVGYMASVEFSGLIREDASSGPNPFREIWNITRVKSGSGGWLVAGVQALQ